MLSILFVSKSILLEKKNTTVISNSYLNYFPIFRCDVGVGVFMTADYLHKGYRPREDAVSGDLPKRSLSVFSQGSK